LAAFRRPMSRWNNSPCDNASGNTKRSVCLILKKFCGGLLTLSEVLEIFGATYLGKGSNCLNVDDWLFPFLLHRGWRYSAFRVIMGDSNCMGVCIMISIGLATLDIIEAVDRDVGAVTVRVGNGTGEF
jgi:hypothetical protein